jgi:DNA mismatch repair protein MutS
MKKFTPIATAIVLSTAVFANAVQQSVALSNQFSEIREMHLSSLPAPVLKKEPSAPKKKTVFEARTGSERPDYLLNDLSEYESHSLVYELFSKLWATAQPLSITNKNAWKDLELISGGNLLKVLNRTKTTLGTVYLASMMTHPCDNVLTLKTRQAIIGALVADEELGKNLDTLLAKVKETESTMLSFWKEENKAEKTFIDQLYSTSTLPILKNLQHANTSPKIQEFFTVSRHLLGLGILAANDGSSVAMGYLQCKHNLYGKFSQEGNMAFCAAMGGLIIYQTYTEFMVIKNYRDLLNYVHEKTNAIATVVRVLDSTAQALNDHPELQYLENAHCLLSFNKKKSSLSPKLQSLISLLQTPTFKGKVSIFSRKGRVRAAYALMQEIKGELAPFLLALGEIDAYLSCATLYNEYKDKENRFVFATYLEQANPSLHSENMWNPFIPSEQAIANSIKIGNNLPLNIILTGPNAGGKSTFIKGITLNVLLAQTISIVPARTFSVTPFAKINTYMNISDDISAGKSLFMSEVLRAQELVDTIQNLPKNKFVFSVMDEMFSGTSPREGEATSYAVAENLGKNNNSLLLLATHFPELKNLEIATNNFKNYQVRVIHHSNGTFSYPFKLQEGAADQNVAIDILKQQGFSSSILDRAQEILVKNR